MYNADFWLFYELVDVVYLNPLDEFFYDKEECANGQTSA